VCGLTTCLWHHLLTSAKVCRWGSTSEFCPCSAQGLLVCRSFWGVVQRQHRLWFSDSVGWGISLDKFSVKSQPSFVWCSSKKDTSKQTLAGWKGYRPSSNELCRHTSDPSHGLRRHMPQLICPVNNHAMPARKWARWIQQREHKQ